MKNFRTITGLLAILLLLCITSCNNRPEPSAEVGWNGKEQVVKVTDNDGQQFLMNYLLYQQLFNNGGYNNVIHHYHSEPTRYRSYSGNSFRRSTVQPASTRGFNTSYRKVEARRSAIARAKSNYSSPKSSSSKSSFFKKSGSSYKPSRSWSRSSSSRSSSRSRR